MAMNHYVGGKKERVAEPPAPKHPPSPLPPSAPPRNGKTPSDALHSLRSGLDGIVSHLDPGHWETEDLLVMAILWLLYRDSGEREMLIALGIYLFL